MTAKPSIAIIDNDLNLVKTYVVERYADAFIAKNPELKKVSYDEYLVLNSGTPVKEEEEEEVKEETATPSEKTETVQKRVEENEEVATEKAEDSVESKENVNQNNNTGTIITSDSIGAIKGRGVNAPSEYTISGIERSGVSVKKTGNTPVEVICTYVKPKNPVSRFVAYVKGIFKK